MARVKLLKYSVQTASWLFGGEREVMIAVASTVPLPFAQMPNPQKGLSMTLTCGSSLQVAVRNYVDHLVLVACVGGAHPEIAEAYFREMNDANPTASLLRILVVGKDADQSHRSEYGSLATDYVLVSHELSGEVATLQLLNAAARSWHAYVSQLPVDQDDEIAHAVGC